MWSCTLARWSQKSHVLRVILGYAGSSRPICTNYCIRPHLSHSFDEHLGFRLYHYEQQTTYYRPLYLCTEEFTSWGTDLGPPLRCWTQGTHAVQLCFPSNTSYAILQILLPECEFSLLHRLKQNVILTLFRFCQIGGYKGIHCGLTCISLVTN